MLQDFLSEVKNEFLPGLHTEVRAQISTRRGVQILSGNLVGNSRNEVSGVSARVYKNGVCGLSSSAEYNTETARNVIKAAGANAEFMEKRTGSGIVKTIDAIPYEKKFMVISPDNIEQKVYIDYAREIDGYIAAKYPDLASRGVIVSCDSMEKLLCTSDGADAHFFAPRSYIYVFMTAMTDAGAPVEVFKAFGGFGTFDNIFDKPSGLFADIDAQHERLMQKREGVFASAGLKTVILGGDLAGMIAHEAVGHTVEADMVLGGSVAASSLGKRVGSDLVSMTDFAYEAFGKQAPLPVYVDDEGVPACDQLLIDHGILVGYMNNRETAKHFGMKPCGNARAFAYSDEPLIRMRNTAVHPGKDKLEDMIASVDDGYYLIETNNGQADSTGEFMFGVTMGYEIKNGKLGKAIFDTTVSGIAFEMLKTVDMVSDNINWSSSGFCGKKQPMPVGMGGPELRCKIMVGGR